MPIDASIPLQLRPIQIESPIQQAGNVLALQGGIQRNALAGMQMQQMQRQMMDEAATREVLSGTQDLNEAANRLLRRGLVNPAMQIRKTDIENRKGQLDIDTKTAALEKGRLELLGGALAPLAARPNVSADELATALANAVMAGFPRDKAEQIANNAPQNVIELGPYVQRLTGLTQHGLQTLQSYMPKVEKIDTGGNIQLTNTNPLAAGGIGAAAAPSITKTVTPDAALRDATTKAEGKLNRGVTVRGQNMTDARAGQIYDSERGMVIDTRAGTARPVTSGSEPLGPKPEKLGEAQVKQLNGVKNLQGAIDDYLVSLGKFGAIDILNPNARARMGTAYNNMMLQAKEAYNLGVLNGPDYSILTSIVTDPTSTKGAITSKDAMADQAKDLKEFMGKIGETVASTTARPSTGKPNAGDVQDGYRFKGGNPADPRNWEKV